ncbi:caprin-2-like [Dreissena polymorpha]|nr:caprin-2-like [Dreissena polymorpha]
MTTILTISACWILVVFIYVDAVTDDDFQSLFVRLSVLEQKQAFFEKRIAVLETEIKLSQKRIADLEKYKTLSERRVASLERKNEARNSRIDVFDAVKNMYAKTAALETNNNEYGKTLFYMKGASIKNNKIQSNIKTAVPENDFEVLPNRNGETYPRQTDHIEIANNSTAVLQSDHRRFAVQENVAFTAMRVPNQQHIGINQDIIFDRILTNEGGGYHPNHGVFTAPQSGVYVISSTILTWMNGEVHAAIVHNGNAVAHIYGHGDNGRHDQGSQTVVIWLNVGDEVAVQNVENPDNNIWGDLYSSFSGYLV